MDFIIVHQTLSIVTHQVVAGTHNYLTVNAKFKGDDWTGLRKWVHFIAKEGEAESVLPMTDDRITEDQHLDLTGGTWKVYIHGNYLEDDEVTERITTNKEYLYVEGDDNGHPFPPLTPDFEEVLANQVMEAKDIAQSVRDDADAGEFDGATFIPDVSDEGDISWTNDQGKENPPTKNIKGPKGDTGESGVYIGTTEPTDPVKEVWINPEGDPGFVFVGEIETTGTHQPGTYDTYTLHRDNGEDLVIRVYNGADGSGIGDMVKAAYDPQNKATDIFEYADDAVEALHDDLADVAFSGDYEDLINTPEFNDRLFEVTREVTTYSEIYAAWLAGKLPYIKYDGVYFYDRHYGPIGGVSYISFTCVSRNETRNVASTIFVSSEDVWTSTADILLTTADVDNALSGSSTNPVQNKIIKQALDGKQDTMTVDAVLSATSTNPIQNKAVQAALQLKQDKITIDSAMSGSSMNPVQNKAIKQYIDSAQGLKVFILSALVSFPANSKYGYSTGVDVVKAGYKCKGCICVQQNDGGGADGTERWSWDIGGYTGSGTEVSEITAIRAIGTRDSQSLTARNVTVNLFCIYETVR